MRRRTSKPQYEEGKTIQQAVRIAVLFMPLVALAHGVASHASPLSSSEPQSAQTTPMASSAAVSPAQPLAASTLFDFKEDEIKFKVETLMSILRDHQHEGWVLAAYPDPKTSRPLIGAGFSLDVQAAEHIQGDPLNPHPFLEPSSAQLWQAAGLSPDQLQAILQQFDHDLKLWKQKKYRKKVRAKALTPQLTEQEATALLRISTIQAIQNARAYCRSFDQLSASQQMALSQLVFQMGVNLEQFQQFLSQLNGDAPHDLALAATEADTTGQHWQSVQRALIESQWATHYTSRATAVIAMFDPDYSQNPDAALRRVQIALPPPVKHHARRHATSMRKVSNSTHSARKSTHKSSTKSKLS
jgi:hypothetical protein